MPDWATIATARQRRASAPGTNIWAGAQRAARPVELDVPESDTEPITPEPARGVGSLFYRPPEEDEGISAGGAGLIGAAAGGGLLLAGLARKNPRMTLDALRKLGSAVQTARYTSMLSGLAPIKSAFGNIGAPIIEYLESGSRLPMREFASRQTVRDWLAAFRDPRITHFVQGSNRINLPGRIMGAGDYATQQALQRGGLSREATERAMLMTPLERSWGPQMGRILDSPITELLIPFRHIPFNQFSEGLLAMSRQHPYKRVTAQMAGIGTLAGAATAEEDYPILPALLAAMAGRYGLPLGLAAALTRIQMNRGGGGIAGSMLPVSEYGFEETLSNPLRPLQPNYWGITRAYRRAAESR